jgi:hypothetical protein
LGYSLLTVDKHVRNYDYGVEIRWASFVMEELMLWRRER